MLISGLDKVFFTRIKSTTQFLFLLILIPTAFAACVRLEPWRPYDEIPEDALIEFNSPDCFGNTFAVGVDKTTHAIRQLWRRKANKFSPTAFDSVDLAKVKEFLLNADNNREKGLFSLSSVIRGLREVWPNLVDDIPSDDKIAQFNLEALTSGDWRYLDL